MTARSGWARPWRYYSLFAIAPVLLVAIAVAGMFFGAEAVRGELSTQMEGLVGTEAAEVVEGLLEGASKPASNSLAMVAGVLADGAGGRRCVS